MADKLISFVAMDGSDVPVLATDNGSEASFSLAVTGAPGGTATIANGADIAEGTTTDAAASSTVAESATARTGIGLWKGVKNILILLNAKFLDKSTVTRTGFSSADASSTPVDLTGAPGTSVKAVATDIIISVVAACTVNILTESGSTIFSIYMGNTSTVVLSPSTYIKGATNNKKLQATTSVTSAIAGVCNWFAEA